MPTTIDIESQRMLLGTTPVRKIYQGQNLIGARIAELFANGAQGVWYDPSDFSTLFQDSAGATPVTAVEQPVGLILDKSGRGNHASQATATRRPVLRQDGNGKHYLYFDGVDDGMSTGSIVWTSAATCFTAIRHTSDRWVDVWLTENGGSGYWAVGQSGSSLTPTGNEVGSAKTYVDGLQLTPNTRNQVALEGFNRHRIFETRALNLTPYSNGLTVGSYSGFMTKGDLFGLIIAQGVTEQESTSVRKYLTSKMGGVE